MQEKEQNEKVKLLEEIHRWRETRGEKYVLLAEQQGRDDILPTQVEAITEMLRQKEEWERLQAMNDEREAAKQQRRAKKVTDIGVWKEMLQHVVYQNEVGASSWQNL
ncbi:hypothetical protein M422DRAFT_251082 [Sphaerobolus stellatus SS14]|uniref:Uncharacterized protein n=1 Tax=Sphaerobolus stellatus (strain SS14) TaxID=990650 RepID=A0A0C9VE52_SPHS4|nr:hypothetical protein M422DRAFT_251082 [Sphaerobolus stellatus SS14]